MERDNDRQQQAGLNPPPVEPPAATRQALGLNLASISDEIRRRFSIKENVRGVVVTRVDALIIVVTLTLMLVLSYIVLRTRTGLALRAVSHRFALERAERIFLPRSSSGSRRTGASRKPTTWPPWPMPPR